MSTLTRDVVWAMPDGPEMDRTVDAEFFGARHVWHYTRLVRDNGSGNIQDIPRYSSDIAAAWAIVNGVGGSDIPRRGRFFTEMWRAVARRRGQPTHYTDVLFMLTPGDICRAALLTMLAEEP